MADGPNEIGNMDDFFEESVDIPRSPAKADVQPMPQQETRSQMAARLRKKRQVHDDEEEEKRMEI